MEGVSLRQIENALQLGHEPLLVALQLPLSGQIGNGIPLAVKVAVLLSFQQHVLIRVGCIVVGIGMFVPIHVEREAVLPCFTEVPFASCGCRGIVVVQVIRIYIATGMIAVPWAIDILDVVRTVGIELKSRHWPIRQVFCNLPVAKLVHGLILAVGQHHALSKLLRCVLPSVVALQLEVRLAAELADVEGKRVVLAKVVVHAVSCAVVCIDTGFRMLLRDDIDDSRHCIAAIQGTLRTFHYLDALDVLGVYQSEVVLASHIAMYALAVYEYQDIAVAKAAQLHLAAHVTLVEGKGGRQRTEDFLYALTTKAVQHLAADDLRLHWHVLQRMLSAGSRDDNLLQLQLFLLALSEQKQRETECNK